MTLINVEVATEAGPITLVGEKCTEHLAIVPVHGHTDTRGDCFTGSWNLTHIPTGASVIPVLEQPADIAIFASRVCDFAAVYPFARWLETAFDLSSSDAENLKKLFMVEPAVQSIRAFYDSPETWVAPTAQTGAADDPEDAS